MGCLLLQYIAIWRFPEIWVTVPSSILDWNCPFRNHPFLGISIYGTPHKSGGTWYPAKQHSLGSPDKSFLGMGWVMLPLKQQAGCGGYSCIREHLKIVSLYLWMYVGILCVYDCMHIYIYARVHVHIYIYIYINFYSFLCDMRICVNRGELSIEAESNHQASNKQIGPAWEIRLSPVANPLSLLRTLHLFSFKAAHMVFSMV
jgi:hypothetical protein